MNQNHSKTQLRDKASRLRMFRYYQVPVHGYYEEGLELLLKYTDTDDLIALLNQLGIGAHIYNKKPDQPIVGKTYAADENFPSLIAGTQWVKQPGHCVLLGQNVFIWCRAGLLKIAANARSSEVKIEHVNAAEVLELNLDIFKNRIQAPPADTKSRIYPKPHRSIFK